MHYLRYNLANSDLWVEKHTGSHVSVFLISCSTCIETASVCNWKSKTFFWSRLLWSCIVILPGTMFWSLSFLIVNRSRKPVAGPAILVNKGYEILKLLIKKFPWDTPLFGHTVQPKRNVALARMSRFASDWMIAEKRGMALILLASIHPYKCFSNTHDRNGCHAPLLDNYSIMSKLTCACECDVALGLYRNSPHHVP